MKTVGNLLWLIFGGLLNAFVWMILGIILCITIIGIPFGKQCFKISRVYFWPMGSSISLNPQKHIVGNVLWLILFGWEIAVENLIFGCLFYLTIIGIPFGKQWFKLAGLSLVPFGAKVE